MRNNVLISCALINIGIQWGFFVISAVLKTELLFDIVGSFTFSLAGTAKLPLGGAATRYGSRSRPGWSSSGLSGWASTCSRASFAAGKIGIKKACRHHGDGNSFLWWTLQAARVVVTLLPTLLLNTSRRSVPLGIRDFAGWCLWAVGFGFEFLADHQMATFHSDPANEGKFISSGLWSVSRHPNYFGEILLWLGLYLSASSVLQRTEFLCVLCPIVDLLLLTRVTGVPVLEREGFRRWGNDPAYHEYLRSTALLVPYLW
uniref:Putative steroid reductase ixodes scapularis steroid reductase n=1 Tax=Ixodes ricinus TaxID=34613 RepID=A0A090X8X4_IXORI